jgi:homoserine dehydrogenase
LQAIDPLPDVTFVALPSSKGELAYQYISYILDMGKIAITAEKGALADHFDALKRKSDNFARFGVNATIGGGTRLTEITRIFCKDKENINQLHFALNGTLTYIMSNWGPYGTAGGNELGQVVDQAVRLGYAEPDASSPEDVIKGEAEGDYPKKFANLYRLLELGPSPLHWKELTFDLSKDDLRRLKREAKVRRFIVSMYPDGHENAQEEAEDKIGGFSGKLDGWHIVGGFQHVDQNPSLSPLAQLTGAENGFVIGLGPNDKDGIYSFSGPGAGVSPTANTALDDWIAKRDQNWQYLRLL